MKNRPHFPRAAALAEEYEMLPRGGTVLAAVSGGRDSMALLHWLCSRKEELGISVAAAHYHHGLRPEADRDMELVRSWCQAQKIPFFAQRGDVAGQAARMGRGIEETGRQLRYEFLNKTAENIGAARIATAHNADDNAETLLLHLTRGTGLQGLTGIPPRRGRLIRPLLTTTRAEIDTYVEAHQIPWTEDATNADTTFARNRLRHQVTPVLQSINPGYVDSVGQTIALLRADQDYLNAQAARLLDRCEPEEGGARVPCGLLRETEFPVASRLVMELLYRLTGKTGFSCAHVNAVLELAAWGEPSGEVSLPHGVTARRVYEHLLLTNRPAREAVSTIPLKNGETVVGEWRITVSGGENGLIVRPRQPGDLLRLPRQREKPLKKLLMEKKIPRYLRDSLPVVADERGILAVAGLGENTDHPLWGKVQITFAPNKNEE